MDIGGTASDESSGKVIRPIYDGKIKSWPAFKIKAEAYIVRKGWSDIIIDGVVDTPDATPLYYLCRNDGEGYSDAMWTPRDIIDAVIDGRVEPTNHVLATLSNDVVAFCGAEIKYSALVWAPGSIFSRVGGPRAVSLHAFFVSKN